MSVLAEKVDQNRAVLLGCLSQDRGQVIAPILMPAELLVPGERIGFLVGTDSGGGPQCENHGDRQYFNGTLISGGGVYFAAASGGDQIVNFDSSTVDALPTFDLRGQSPQVTAYAVGQ